MIYLSVIELLLHQKTEGERTVKDNAIKMGISDTCSFRYLVLLVKISRGSAICKKLC